MTLWALVVTTSENVITREETGTDFSPVILETTAVYSGSYVVGEVYSNVSYSIEVLRNSDMATLLNETFTRTGDRADLQEFKISLEKPGLVTVKIEFNLPPDIEKPAVYFQIDLTFRIDVQKMVGTLLYPTAVSTIILVLSLITDRWLIEMPLQWKVFSHVPKSDMIEIVAVPVLTIIVYGFKPIAGITSTKALQILEMFSENMRFVMAFTVLAPAFAMLTFNLRKKEVQYLWIIEDGRARLMKCRIPLMILHTASIGTGLILYYHLLNNVIFGTLTLDEYILVSILRLILLVLSNTIISVHIYFLARDIIITAGVSTTLLVLLELTDVDVIPTLGTIRHGVAELVSLIIIVLGGYFAIRRYMNMGVTK